MADIEQLYQNILGRAPDEGGLAYWSSYQGDPTAAFTAAAQQELAARPTTLADQGITSLPAAQTTVANPAVQQGLIQQAATPNVTPVTPPVDYSNLVTQAYGTLGRTGIGEGQGQIDQPGFDYWTNQLKTGAVTPEQFQSAFKNAAEENYIKQAYKDLFGREAEDTGLKYWTGALDTTNKQDIYNAIMGGARGTDILDLSKSQAGAYSPEALQKYLAGEQDVLNEYEALRKRGISAEQANLAPDYFANVGNLYGTSVDQTITDVLGKDYTSKLTAEQKQSLVDNLMAGKTSREDVSKLFQESTANKNQEAARIANSYVAMYGGSQDDANALYAKLMGQSYKGPGKVDAQFETLAKDAFNKSLKTDASGIYDLIDNAANKEGAEKQKFFIDNPEQLAIHKNIGESVAFENAGTGGQYGYYKGIPILKYSEAVKPFEELNSDYITGNAPDKLDNAMGWDTGSLAALEARGPAAFGIRKEQTQANPFTGEEAKTTYTGDMNAVAKQFGIDPSKYESQDKLYDAINNATKDFYYIAGKTGKDTGGIGKEVNGVKQTAAFTNPDVANYNHAAVLYKRVGDKLIPIPETLKGYNAEMELKKGSWFSDTFGGLASIPLVAEIAAIAQPELYPAIKAAQAAALGGGLSDMIKAGGTAYLATQGAKLISPTISQAVGGDKLLTQLGTGATLGGGIAALTNRDIGQGALMGAAGAGLAYGTNKLVPEQGIQMANDLGIDPKYQSMFANTLARLGPTILTGGKVDPTKVLMSYMMNQAMKEGRNTITQGTK